MDPILEILIDFLFEIAGQLILELFFELGAKAFQQIFFSEDRKGHFSLSFSSWAVMGGLGGALSLFFFPMHFLKTQGLRQANLLLTPLLLGVFMSERGKRLQAKDRDVVGLDSFLYGFLFAFVFALVRYRWAH